MKRPMSFFYAHCLLHSYLWTYTIQSRRPPLEGDPSAIPERSVLTSFITVINESKRYPTVLSMTSRMSDVALLSDNARLAPTLLLLLGGPRVLDKSSVVLTSARSDQRRLALRCPLPCHQGRRLVPDCRMPTYGLGHA